MGNCVCSKRSIILNGRTYIIRDSLGEGGFSVVELVEDVRTRKFYALKRITCHSPDDQKVALSEVEVHSKLSHPNIIECVASDVKGQPDLLGSKTSEVFMLLPFFSKGTLQDELNSRALEKKFLDEGTIMRIMTGVCEAVQHLHQQTPPLAHRDIKAANVLLHHDLAPVLMDLGSVAPARLEVRSVGEARQLQDTAAERCSMTYRAPELFQVQSGAVVTEATDIWSLGCLLHALCFFKSPYDVVYERGDSVALAVIAGKINLPEPNPFSDELCGLMRAMLSVEASSRPTISEVLDRVRVLANAPVC